MNRKLLGYSPGLDVFDDAIAARRGASNRTRIDREIVALETACAEQAAELLDAPRGPRLAALAGAAHARFFGMELEGLSPEDKEF